MVCYIINPVRVCYKLQKVAHSRLVPLYNTHVFLLLFYVGNIIKYNSINTPSMPRHTVLIILFSFTLIHTI